MSEKPKIRLHLSALDTLMPMHLLLDESGRIAHAGPTTIKVFGGRSHIGTPMLDLFELRRRSEEEIIERLKQGATGKVLLRLKAEPSIQFVGLAVPRPGYDGLLVNLAFGISIFDAVRRFNLAGSDFAATDQTIELLYLAEANSAVMAESIALNNRLHGAKQDAEVEAITDTLTGLRNRRALDRELNRLVERGSPFALAQLDLDFFKDVNDTLGHAAGDFVLCEVARILNEETRQEDTVARVGGDEFVILLRDLVDEDRLRDLGERVIERLEVPHQFQGQTCRISASVGIAVSSHYDAAQADEMMKDADEALYASKAAGRAQLTFAVPKTLGVQVAKMPDRSAG